MKKGFIISKKAVFITVFFMAVSMVLSGQTISVLADEADNGIQEASQNQQNDAVPSPSDQNQQSDPVQPDQSQQNDPVQPDQGGEDTSGQKDGDSQELEDSKLEDAEPEKIPQVKAALQEKKNAKAATIRWNDVDGAQAYRVQRSQEKDGKYKNVAVLEDTSDSGNAKIKYKDTSVKRGSSYFYRVAVKMENGTTYYSNIVSFSCPLAKVSGVRLVRYSSSSIKAAWNPSKDKQTQYYKVYYAKKEDGEYKLAGTTQNTWYRVTGLKNNQDYYFRVKACAAKKASGLDSELSESVQMRTVPYHRTTIFAGDSITVGLRTYNLLNSMAIEGNKGIVAEVGLNTTTFRTRRVFDGKTGVESIIAAKPYRVYLMLGDNEIHYRSKEDTVAGYKEILKQIQAGTPDTDIVVLAATPVTSAKVKERSGFAQIPAYNQSLKALAKSMGARYFDCTDFLKDSSGWLKSSYSAGDGIHWKAEVYREYVKRLEAYDKSLDANESAK